MRFFRVKLLEKVVLVLVAKSGDKRVAQEAKQVKRFSKRDEI